MGDRAERSQLTPRIAANPGAGASVVHVEVSAAVGFVRGRTPKHQCCADRVPNCLVERELALR